jgi:hypothetical protein
MRAILAGICLVLCLAVSRINGDAIACDVATQPRVMIDPTGHFTTPNFPANYVNRADCQWHIIAQPGHVVRIDFTAFNVERGYDFVWFFDGSSNLSVALTGLTGTRNPPPMMLAGTMQNMFAQFTTDINTVASGFNATYTSVHPSEITGPCNALSRPAMLTGDMGSFSSLYFPDPYPLLCKCHWLITSSMPNGRVQLDFTMFNTQANSDWVRLFDGMTENDMMMARLSGQYQPAPTGFVTITQHMLVTFDADNQASIQGFSATYTSLGAVALIN